MRPSFVVNRPRLVTACLAATTTTVRAGSGFGKSTLAQQIAAATELGILVALGAAPNGTAALAGAVASGLRMRGLHDAADAAAARTDEPDVLNQVLATIGEPATMLIDGAELLGQDDAAKVAALVRNPGHHRIVVFGRDFSGDIVDALPAGSGRLTAADLAFDADETIELLRRAADIDLTRPQAEALVEATDGWVAALLLAGPRLSASSDRAATVRSLASSGRLMAHLVNRLAPEGTPRRHALESLAQLPLIDREVAARVASTEIFDELVHAGLPLREHLSGWFELPGPLTDVIGPAPLDPEVVSEVAKLYRVRGETETALQLLAVQSPDDAAGLLADLALHESARLRPDFLVDLFDRLPDDAVRRVPGAALGVSHVLTIDPRLPIRERILARARSLCEDDGIRLHLDLEWAHLQVQTGRDEGGGHRDAAALLDICGPDAPPAMRARALTVIGRSSADPDHVRARSRDELTRMRDDLLAAARAWQDAGEPTGEGYCRMLAGFLGEFRLGHYDQAVEQLQQALSLLGPRPLTRAAVLPFIAMTLVDAGDYTWARSVIERANHAASLIGSTRGLAYTAWAEARMASQRGDRDGVPVLLAKTAAALGGWVDTSGGAAFHADAAQLLDRVGLKDEAMAALARAEELDPSYDHLPTLAAFFVHARHRRLPAAQEALDRALARDDLEPRDHWRIPLFRAWMLLEVDPDTARRDAVRAFAEAAALDRPDLPLIREGEIARALLPVACEAGSAEAEALLAREAGQIRMLGTFEIHSLGRTIRPEPGLSSELLAFVGVNGGRVRAEAAIETFWPETHPETGRQRLRTVLSRLRRDIGPLVDRDGDDLVLSAGIETDIAVFERLAARAVSAPPGSARALAAARQAVDVYEGDLLPGLPYEQWTVGPRTNLERRFAMLIDELVASAERSGDLDEALRWVALGLRTAPDDVDLLTRQAVLLSQQGRVGRARSAATHAREAARRLGLPAPPDLGPLLGGPGQGD